MILYLLGEESSAGREPVTSMVPFPFLLQGARMQHLSSINLCVRIATAELVWIHYPEGSVEYISHFCKEIMREKAKEEVDRKDSRIKS